MVLGLLFISIDLSNPTTVKAKTIEEIFREAKMSKTEKMLRKLNPVNYFKKRKECKEEADRADTVYEGKQRYKSCMDN